MSLVNYPAPSCKAQQTAATRNKVSTRPRAQLADPDLYGGHYIAVRSPRKPFPKVAQCDPKRLRSFVTPVLSVADINHAPVTRYAESALNAQSQTHR